MPATLSMGSNGPEVKILQTRLNFHPTTALALLAVDGFLGPQTLARVREFQTNNALAADGIAGPKTWGKLPPFDSSSTAPMTGCDCATCDPKTPTSSILPRFTLLATKDPLHALLAYGVRRVPCVPCLLLRSPGLFADWMRSS